jgi:hypothetical protein
MDSPWKYGHYEPRPLSLRQAQALVLAPYAPGVCFKCNKTLEVLRRKRDSHDPNPVLTGGGHEPAGYWLCCPAWKGAIGWRWQHQSWGTTQLAGDAHARWFLGPATD